MVTGTILGARAPLGVFQGLSGGEDPPPPVRPVLHDPVPVARAGEEVPLRRLPHGQVERPPDRPGLPPVVLALQR